MSLPKQCERYDRKARAAGPAAYFRNACTTTLTDDGGFVVYSDDFLPLLGPSPRLEMLLENKTYPFAHEAGVYIPATGEVFVTSNQFQQDGQKKIQISRVQHDGQAWKAEEIDPGIQMGNGAVNYRDGVLFCEQGTFTESGGLTYMDRKPPYKTETILSNYHGRWFNSVNDVVVHSDGSIWFTDPTYGHEQNIRPRPQLPCQVYRYDPATGDTRAVASGFGKPNGIAFSPDEQTVYITDTVAIHGEGVYSSDKDASIYAMDVTTRNNAPFLTNRRQFALADTGVPDGIKCDVAGNVYSGCGDGVHAWTPGGTLIGKIYVPGGCANFCFGQRGELFLLNEHRLWRAQLAGETKGALLGV